MITLLNQQQAALVDFVASLIEDVGVVGPLTHDAIANLDAADYDISSHFAVHLSSVQDFVSGLASLADSIVESRSGPVDLTLERHRICLSHRVRPA